MIKFITIIPYNTQYEYYYLNLKLVRIIEEIFIGGVIVCYAKPGPRCSYHAKKSLDKAKLDLIIAKKSKDDYKISQAKTQLIEKLQIWYSTPQGQEHLQNKIESCDSLKEKEFNQKLLAKAQKLRNQQKQQLERHINFNSDGINNITGTPYDVNGLDKNGQPPYITRKEIEMFENADCWQLAKAIHEKKNYDYVMYYVKLEGEEESSQKSEGWFHMANIDEKGQIVDIRGVSSQEQALAEWEDTMYEEGEIGMCVVKENEFNNYIHDDLETFNPTQEQIKKSAEKVIALTQLDRG